MFKKIVIYLLQMSVFYKRYNLSDGKPLVGYEIQKVYGNEYSFIVGIIIVDNAIALEESMICTGALVSLYHVLSSAHCLDDIDDIIFGILAESNVYRNNVLHHPNWWITYDQWATISDIALRYRQNDIAMIKMIQAVASTTVTPAPISGIEHYFRLYGEQVTLAGWGDSNEGEAPENLQAATVQIISNEECGTLASDLQGTTIRIPARYFCTRADPLVRVVGGDCGGPVLYEGRIIGVNKGVFPEDEEYCEDAVNFHVGIHYYIGFVNAIMSM